ncbi:MAG TPA: flagellar hook-length control protein FliK [Rhizomicrobium sp.]|nr:flagellar hook-length control protein FliK [Rhizomicrobium sp.]
MASLAVNTNAPAAAAQVASAAAPDANLDAMFAGLIAQMAPAQNNALQIPANDADTAPAPKNPSQKITAKADPAAILAGLAMPNAQIQIVPVKPADAGVADATKAAKTPKPVNMDMLRALVAKASDQPATKPDAQLPVTGKEPSDAKTDSKAPAQAKSADPATLAAAIHNNVKAVQPAQTTEAQTLTVRFDAKADSNGTQSDSGNSKNQDQRGNSAPNAPQAAQTAQPAANAPVATQTAQPAHAASPAAIAPVQATQQNAPVAANLHVTAQTHQSEPAPDLGALAITIATKSREGSKQFDIRLDPPEMGRIDVRLSVDDNGKAQAHLSADKPQTLELLQRDSRNLERALKDAGLDLSNNGLNFSLKGEQRQADGGARTPSRSRQLTIHAVAATGAAPMNSIASNSATLDITV